MYVALYICLGCMLVFGFVSVLSRHLISAAISLAAVSAACIPAGPPPTIRTVFLAAACATSAESSFPRFERIFKRILSVGLKNQISYT